MSNIKELAKKFGVEFSVPTRELMISIKPEHAVNILNGDKTIDIRKTMPKCELPIDVYLYCTKEKPYITQQSTHQFTIRDNKDYTNLVNGKVVAKFTLKWCDKRSIAGLTHSLSDFNTFLKRAGIDWYRNSKEFHDYVNGKDYIYAWHIDNLVIFDKPLELKDFFHYKRKLIDCGRDCPPYVDEVKTDLTKAPQKMAWVYRKETL